MVHVVVQYMCGVLLSVNIANILHNMGPLNKSSKGKLLRKQSLFTTGTQAFKEFWKCLH